MKRGQRRLAVDTLRAAAAGRLSREVGREAVYRLLAGSDEPMAESAEPASDSALADSFEAALSALPALLQEREAARADADATAARLEEIARVSPVESRTRAAGLSPTDLRAVVEALVRRADEAALDEPAHAVTLASLAVAAVEAEARHSADPRVHDLRSAARRSFAEAAYRSGDLVAADGALAEAKGCAQLGTLDPVLRAELLRLEAEIRSDQSRYGEAVRLARRAVRLLHRARETRLEARARLSLAIKLECDGRLSEALEENARALALVDAERDGRWVLAAEFNRAHWLNDAGDSAAARAALPRLAELAARFGRVTDHVRLDWLAARIAAREGDLARAVEIYRLVLARCLELETVHDSALAALEMAVLLLELGRADEVLPLADTVAPIFRAQGVEPEAAAAVLLAAKSLRRGIAAREVLLNLIAARSSARGAR